MARGFAQRQKPVWRQVRRSMPSPPKTFPGPRGKHGWTDPGKPRRQETELPPEHRARQEDAMDELEKAFEAAAGEVKQLKARPSESDLLKLYALFKQALVGDASGPRPDPADFVAEAKREAWDALRGTPRAQAMRDYVALVEKLKT